MNLTPDTDFYGSIHRPKGHWFDGTWIPAHYVDLRQFEDCFIVPIALPANLHHYRSKDNGVCVTAFAVHSQKFRSLDEVRDVMSKGLSYVLYLQAHDACFMLRWYTYSEGTEEYEGSLMTRSGKIEHDRYPHTCPRCSAPAYVGFSDIDCSGGCR